MQKKLVYSFVKINVYLNYLYFTQTMYINPVLSKASPNLSKVIRKASGNPT